MAWGAKHSLLSTCVKDRDVRATFSKMEMFAILFSQPPDCFCGFCRRIFSPHFVGDNALQKSYCKI